MTHINTNLSARAEAYFSGKEQLVRSLTALANHLHNRHESCARHPKALPQAILPSCGRLITSSPIWQTSLVWNCLALRFNKGA